jgi:hypothetical protein
MGSQKSADLFPLVLYCCTMDVNDRANGLVGQARKVRLA